MDPDAIDACVIRSSIITIHLHRRLQAIRRAHYIIHIAIWQHAVHVCALTSLECCGSLASCSGRCTDNWQSVDSHLEADVVDHNVAVDSNSLQVALGEVIGEAANLLGGYGGAVLQAREPAALLP